MLRRIAAVLALGGVAAACSSDGTLVPGAAPDAGSSGADAGLDAWGAGPGPDAGPDAGSTPCPAGREPATPIEYGACAVAQAEAAAHTSAAVRLAVVTDAGAAAALAAQSVTLDARAESYAVVADAGSTLVVGRDAVGAMYGALEIAERLGLDGASVLPPASPITGAPHVAFRAANFFLTLPADGETSWWFYDDGFWTQYLDLLAHARIDVLDLHAMYHLDSTGFPNALLYFGSSGSFPAVGVPAADRAKNVAELQRILALATARGMRVGLMSYRADTSLDTVTAGPALSTADLTTYTREAAESVVRAVPGLWALGFRIGEGTEPASFYEASFVAGVQAAGAGTRLYTRTWGATKPDILGLAAASGPGFFVEAKYNGEHLAAPYVVAGGSMAGWSDYSYQSFLDPPVPYPFVLQVRAGGTHRIFRHASYARVARAVGALALSPRIEGFTFEAAHAYLPQRDFYHAAADVFSPWTFRRDELSYALFGRLGYDPATPERVFRAALAARVGTDGLWDAVQAASEIVPWIQTAHTCGPDQRDYAPELELGGPVGYWASPSSTTPPAHACNHVHVAFDGLSFATPYEAAADLLAGASTTRVRPVDVAALVLAAATKAREAAGVAIDAGNAEARDVVRECVALSDLGTWWAHKLRAATALAVYAGSGAADWLAAARSESALATTAFEALATDTGYIAPFDEMMRMAPLGLTPFHWRSELPRLAEDASSIDAVVSAVTASPPAFTGTLPAASAWLAATRGAGPGLANLAVSPQSATAPSWSVTARFAGALPAGATVRVLWKPFQSEVDWTPVAATQSAGGWSATVPGAGEGAMFAVEVAAPAGAPGWRYPDVLSATPYVALAP